MYFSREIDLVRIIVTILGLISYIDESFEYELCEPSMNRVTTHPNENTIGSIRFNSYYQNTGPMALSSCVKGTINSQIKSELNINKNAARRVHLGGAFLKSEFKQNDLEKDYEFYYDLISIFYSTSGFCEGNVSKETISAFNGIIKEMTRLESSYESKKKIYEPSTTSSNTIVSRLLSNSPNIGKTSKPFKKGEIALLKLLKNRELDCIMEYFPQKKREEVASLLKRIDKKETCFDKSTADEKGELEFPLFSDTSLMDQWFD